MCFFITLTLLLQLDRPEVLEDRINEIVNDKFDKLRRDESALSRADGINCLNNFVYDSIKLEIVNKGMNVKWDYKLNNTMKFEYFYDYLLRVEIS